jgi:hypothetical protein
MTIARVEKSRSALLWRGVAHFPVDPESRDAISERKE